MEEISVITAPMGPLDFLFRALLIAAFVVEIWAFIDALRHADSAYRAAGKQSRVIWLLILGVALGVGLGGAAGYIGVFSLFPVAGFVAAAIYLVDVRPKVREFKGRSGGGNSSSGPYGPW